MFSLIQVKEDVQDELQEVRAQLDNLKNMPSRGVPERVEEEGEIVLLKTALADTQEELARTKAAVELRAIFDMADVDCSGFIDANELLALGRAVNPSFSPKQCRDLLGRMDSNHDSKVQSTSPY